MKPAKSLFPVFLWIVRIAVVFAVYVRFIGLIRSFETDEWSFYIAAAFGLFAVLLLLGGFSRKHNLTIISGLIIAVLSVYQMIQLGFGIGQSMAFYGLMTSIGLLFVSLGNKK
ncbi:MAG: hypothetical protein K9H84_06605 [Bacteroidales bacterium]|nr:hypothetical protein [Bacteroidales bacterium]